MDSEDEILEAEVRAYLAEVRGCMAELMNETRSPSEIVRDAYRDVLRKAMVACGYGAGEIARTTLAVTAVEQTNGRVEVVCSMPADVAAVLGLQREE